MTQETQNAQLQTPTDMGEEMEDSALNYHDQEDRRKQLGLEKPCYDPYDWTVELGSLVTDLMFACSDAEADPITLSPASQEGLAKLLYSLTQQAFDARMCK